MQKYKKIVVCVICIVMMLAIFSYLRYYHKTHPFIGEEVINVKIIDSMTEDRLKISERKAFAKKFHKMKVQKMNSNIQKIVLHSSRNFQVETKDTAYEITLYGKVGDIYLCEINDERYQVTEKTYYELDRLYDECFRTLHEELFDGFQNSKFLYIKSGVGFQEKELSESKFKEVVEILQTMSILDNAEENPLSLFYGMQLLRIKTEKDSIVIKNIDFYDDKSVVCSFNGSSYLIDKESGEKLAGILGSTD